MKYCLNCGKSFKKWGNLKKCCCKKCTDAYYLRIHPESHQKSWRKYNSVHLEEIREKSRQNYDKHKDQYLSYRKAHHLENNARTRAKYAIKKAGIPKSCNECKTIKNIHVHHIDGNPFNNSLTNLVYLCTICHGKIHSSSFVGNI